MITQDELKKLFSYNPETGKLTRLIRTARRAKVGQVAGNVNSRGYVDIQLHGQRYKAHRLVWLYVHGVWPEIGLDHINGIRSDNRIVNLRYATPSQNQHNRGKPKNNTSGIKGVYWDKARKKWHAQINLDDTVIYLGRFTDSKDAAKAYATAALKFHGEFSNQST